MTGWTWLKRGVQCSRWINRYISVTSDQPVRIGIFEEQAMRVLICYQRSRKCEECFLMPARGFCCHMTSCIKSWSFSSDTNGFCSAGKAERLMKEDLRKGWRCLEWPNEYTSMHRRLRALLFDRLRLFDYMAGSAFIIDKFVGYGVCQSDQKRGEKGTCLLGEVLPSSSRTI